MKHRIIPPGEKSRPVKPSALARIPSAQRDMAALWCVRSWRERSSEKQRGIAALWRERGSATKRIVTGRYSREADGYKAYAVSYMLCKRYGIEAKGYDIGRLNSVFKGQDPREDVPAALSDMRETFKSLNGRMARAMGLTRDTKQKEPER